MSNSRALALRGALSNHVAGRGRRYDAELKARVIAFAHAARRDRKSWAWIATEVGVCLETLRRWCAGVSTKGAMRSVEIVEARSTALAIVTPSGLRVEGITLDEVAILLRAVR